MTDAPKLIDPFARAITYLRVSVTDRCDFRCVYCMSEIGRTGSAVFGLYCKWRGKAADHGRGAFGAQGYYDLFSRHVAAFGKRRAERADGYDERQPAAQTRADLGRLRREADQCVAGYFG